MRRAAAALALATALLVAAGLFDAEPLWVPGAALFLAVVTGAAWTLLAQEGATVSREVGSRRVVEDEPLHVAICARAGRLPLPGGSLEDPLLEHPVALRPGRHEARVGIQVRFQRRGMRRLAPARLRVGDPLGLIDLLAAEGEPDEVLVLPRVSEVIVPPNDGGRARGLGALALRGAGAGEMDGLRPHDPASPASRIHWPVLARGGGLVERRLRPEADDRPLLVLDPSAPASPESLDAAVRATASLCLAIARTGGCSLLLPGDRRPTNVGEDLGAWPAAHARLALVAAGRPPALGSAVVRTGPVIYVTAHPGRRMPRGLAAHAPARVIIVTPGGAVRDAVFTVAGCAGREVRRMSRSGVAL